MDEPRGPPYTPAEEVLDPKTLEVAMLRLCVDCIHSLKDSSEEPCKACLASRNPDDPDDWDRPHFVPSEDQNDVEVD